MKKNRKKRAIAVLITAVLVSTFFLPLIGCGGCSGRIEAIVFSRSELDLKMGETYKVTGSLISFEPKLTSQKRYTLSSSDESVAKVRLNEIIAVAPGEAEITAVSDYNADVKASLTVRVSYAVPTELEIKTVGDRIQYADSPTRLIYEVTADTALDPEYRFDWKVGINSYDDSGPTLRIMPRYVGKYDVKVEIAGLGLSAETVFKVFSEKAKDACAEYVGETVQENSYTPVKATASWSLPSGDPTPFVDWYVNGELYLSDTKTLSFTPKEAGVYEIELKVNDEPAPIGGAEKLVVTAKGSVVPSNVRYEFDNVYPEISLLWDSPPAPKMNFGIKIVNLTTGKTDESITTTNASTRPYFDGNSFRAGSFLDLVENEYEIYVRSLGDGATYTASDYGDPVRTTRISRAAVPYLEKKVPAGMLDFHAYSDEDFLELLAYHFSFRDGGDIDYRVYMGYDSVYDIDTLVSIGFSYGSSVGSYKLLPSGDSSKGSVCRVRVLAYNASAPDRNGASENYELHALEPHIAETPDRKTTHVFEIEKSRFRAEVSASEELYRVVEMGVCPVPREGSAASKLYAYARRLLMTIISDDMSDREKVHAIYDWIMWNVSYDSMAAGDKDVISSSHYYAYYLEGVLSDTGVAVCDGMAKAFSLLCNMEGIKAYRICGRAGTSVSGASGAELTKIKQKWGGHAWNKVCIDGEWYAVDPTWGDAQKVMYGKDYETSLHDYLFVSDAAMADTHEVTTDMHNYPTPRDSYNIYKDIVWEYEKGGQRLSVDSYIDSVGTQLDLELIACLDALVYAARQDTVISPSGERARFKPYSVAGRTETRSYYGMELRYSDLSKKQCLAAARGSKAYYGTREIDPKNTIDSVLSEYGYDADDYLIVTVADSILIMLEPIAY